MIRSKELEDKVYEPEHIEQVLTEIESKFAFYFKSFAQQSLGLVFDEQLEKWTREQEKYRDYLDPAALEEFDHDPNAFKNHTRKRCPIISRCLRAPDEVMDAYRRSFCQISGRELLDTVRSISEFGRSYVAAFDGQTHEHALTSSDLGLELLNESEYGCIGVVGYGVQSSLLYGLYGRCFAHRSQDAVWSLFFLSGRKDFGLRDGSEFLMVHAKEGTCEQNYFYPAELFGFYALRLFLMLKRGCEAQGVRFHDLYRYVYLSRFCGHVADTHRKDINVFKFSSEHVERQPWF